MSGAVWLGLGVPGMSDIRVCGLETGLGSWEGHHWTLCFTKQQQVASVTLSNWGWSWPSCWLPVDEQDVEQDLGSDHFTRG